MSRINNHLLLALFVIGLIGLSSYILDDRPITGLQVRELTSNNIEVNNPNLTQDQSQKCPIILSISCPFDEDC